MAEMQFPAVVVEQTAGVVKWNYEDIKNFLDEALEEYRNIVYTDDTIGMAKRDRKALNDLSEAIDQRRLEIRRNCLAPFEVIDRQAKELLSMIGGPLQEIKKQTDAYENRRREAVRKDIRAFWDEKSKTLPETLREKAWNRLYDTRWENVATTKKAWQTGVMDGIQKIILEIATIRGFEDRLAAEGMKSYERDMDLARAISRMNDLRRMVEEDRKREEEQKRAAEEKARREKEAAEAKEREAALRKSWAEAIAKKEGTATAPAVSPDVPPTAEQGTVPAADKPEATQAHTAAPAPSPAPAAPSNNAFRAAVQSAAPQETAQPAEAGQETMFCEIRLIGQKDAINRVVAFAKYCGVKYTIHSAGKEEV